MLFHDIHQNPSVCCFLVQIRAIAVFARIKKWFIVPGPIHQNSSLLSWVMLPKTDRTVQASALGRKKRDHVATLSSSRSLFRLFSYYPG